MELDILLPAENKNTANYADLIYIGCTTLYPLSLIYGREQLASLFSDIGNLFLTWYHHFSNNFSIGKWLNYSPANNHSKIIMHNA